MGKLILTTGDYIANSENMDAIVNAQNKYMSNGSGICGAIYRASGKELLDYCQQKYDKNMETGEVRITPGFNLKMDIIHVLAPKSFEEDNPIARLIDTYNNLLNEIKQHKYKNVLMTSLGTGIHGYKHEEVAKPLMELLINYCVNNDVNIYFNNIYPIYKDIYLKELLTIDNIDLKKELSNKKINEITSYIDSIGIGDLFISDKYDDFVDGKTIDDMSLSEKIIYILFCINNNHFEEVEKTIKSM